MTTKKESLQNVSDIKKSKRIGNNTFEVIYNNNDKAIRLHYTNIVTYKNDGRIILNTGKWKTVTTKQRMNASLEKLSIYQKNHIWYVIQNKDYKNPILFYDNMVFDNKGNLLSEKKIDNTKKNNKLKNQIKKYCNLLDNKEMPLPDYGDCWYCLMKTNNNKTLGDAIENNQHLMNHIKENYLHGSILINAMRESEYNDMQIEFHYQIKNKDTFKRALRKYLIKRLITK